MPQTIIKYKILVASPSDVKDEREAIDEVVVELNNTYGSRINLVIEVIKWETHSAPAASKTSIQDKIDEDFGEDYDLFIGVLWKRFGTPTGIYGSGTEQEFRNAHQRFLDNVNPFQILFYFKTASPASLSEINPGELQKVNSFKISLGEIGIFHWEYNSVDDFQKFLRIHVPKRLDELRQGLMKLNAEEVPQEVHVEVVEELCVVDYEELVEESFSSALAATSQIAASIVWIGNEINKKAEEITSLKSANPQIGNKRLKGFYKRTADVMNDFVQRVKPEIPIFIKNFESGVNAYSSLITILRTYFSVSDDDTQDSISTLQSVIEGIETALIGTRTFLKSVSSLPRVEKDFNKARNNTETILRELISKFETAYSITIELRKTIKGF